MCGPGKSPPTTYPWSSNSISEMGDLARLIVLLVAAGVTVTVAGGWMAWWMAEERRLTRLVRRALGGEADAAIVARGRGCAAGFRVEADQFVVMSGGGAKALLYRLDALDGAELIIDHAVAGRVFRGESRRPVDRIETAPQSVSLRLIFNDPKNPDFDLDLWRVDDLARRHAPVPGDVIHEGRSWLARIDAILRRGPRQRIAAPASLAAEPAPWEEDDAEG
jgi:hypothetical protein